MLDRHVKLQLCQIMHRFCLFSSTSTGHDFKLSQSIDDIVREQIFRQSHVSHMGKGMSVVAGNGGQGVQAVNQLGMFGLYERTGSREHGVGIGGM